MIKLLLLLTLVAFAAAATQGHDNGRLKYQSTLRKLRNAVRTKGCDSNVCFAIDTSGSVSRYEYGLQRDFMIDVTAIIGEGSRSNFAAVQYGRQAYTISNFVSDAGDFNQIVDKARFQNDGSTSVGSGIVWCDSRMRRRVNDVNNMVVIGDGRNNLGGDPVRRANIFRKRTANAVVSTVGVGYKDTKTLEKIAGDASRVFTVDDYFELSEVVEILVSDICNFSLFD